MLEVLRESIVKNKADISMARLVSINEGQIPKRIIEENSLTVLKNNETIRNILYQDKRLTIAISPKLYSKKVIDKIRFNKSLSYSEDLVFLIEAMLNSKKIVINSELLYFYVQRKGSAINSEFSHKRMDSLKAAQSIVEMSKNNKTLIPEKATESFVFTTAISLLLVDSIDKDEFRPEYNECRDVIKKYNKKVLFDNNSRNIVRLYAFISIFSINLLLAFYKTKFLIASKIRTFAKGHL